MEYITKKLVTIITELSLEAKLKSDIEACGASGYTLTGASGKGSRGKRESNWDPNSNIRIEVICNAKIATELTELIFKKYFNNFAMVTYTQDVNVMRGNKF